MSDDARLPSSKPMSLDEMIEAADAYVLPCDVKVGHTTITAGCKVGTVLRSIKNHAEARIAFGSPNQQEKAS